MHRSVVTSKEDSCRRQRLWRSPSSLSNPAQTRWKLWPSKRSSWLLYWCATSLAGNFLCRRQSSSQRHLPRQCYDSKRARRKQPNKQEKLNEKKLLFKDFKHPSQKSLLIVATISKSFQSIFRLQLTSQFFLCEWGEKKQPRRWLGSLCGCGCSRELLTLRQYERKHQSCLIELLPKLVESSANCFHHPSVWFLSHFNQMIIQLPQKQIQ